jgi:thiol-disulfide isomerase/thioredoxin
MSNRGVRSDRNARAGRGGIADPRTVRRKATSRPFATARVVIVGVAVALLVVALVVARTFRRAPTHAPAENGPVAVSVMQNLTTVPAAEFDSVGQGTATVLPTPVRATLLRGPKGLPQVVYVGAEYCPYCAAERWAMVVALSRFGSFSGLRTSLSAADDVYPSTPTFTFVGSTYNSDVVEFSSVETQSNQKINSAYAPLQTPTASQEQLVAQYDAPPFVPAASTGSIPFIDVANQYVVVGSTFNPDVLANRSWDEIAAGLHQPDSDQAKAIVGSANVLTAAICSATNNAPASVCGQPAIATIEQNLAKNPVPRATP